MSGQRLTEAQQLLAVHVSEIMRSGMGRHNLYISNLSKLIKFEYRFCEDRQWRFDVAVPLTMWAFECNGHFQGKHGVGWSNDAEKMNTAQALGWKVFVFTNREVLTGRAKEWLQAWL